MTATGTNETMQAMIPVFPDERERFWCEPEFLEALSALVAALGTPGSGHAPAVVTDQPAVARAVRDLCPVTEVAEGSADEAGLPLPRGTKTACRALGLNPGQPVAVVDFRTPLLDAAALDDAAEAYRNAGCGLFLSGRPMEDHPCQLRRFLLFEDIGLIHLLDDAAGESRIFTRPFHLDWGLRTVAGDGCARNLVLTADGRAPVFRPAGPSSGEAPAVLWHKEDAGTARISVSRTLLPAGTAGFALNAAGTAPAFILSGDGTDRWRIRACDPAPDGASILLRLLPMQDGATPFELPLAGGVFHRALAADCGAIFYWHFQPVASGGYDIVDHFSTDNALWFYDIARNRMIRKADGALIHGRQNFPPVHYPDGALALLRPGDLDRSPDIRLHELPPRTTYRVRRRQDLAVVGLYRAMAGRLARGKGGAA